MYFVSDKDYFVVTMMNTNSWSSQVAVAVAVAVVVVVVVVACENIRFSSLLGEEQGETDVFAGYSGSGSSSSVVRNFRKRCGNAAMPWSGKNTATTGLITNVWSPPIAQHINDVRLTNLQCQPMSSF